MKNKIVASVLVFSLLGAEVVKASNSFWDEEVFTNFTTPGVATDPNTGTSYFSGGSYHVKFKSQNEFQPLFQVGAPSVKIGCRGVSLNLGFGSLINFEQLSKQLQEAGASIAWGVLIGLAYSLPALKQVFDTIQDWAAKIQNMLANSCDAGKALGKNIAGDYTGLGYKGIDSADNWLSNLDKTLKTHISGPLNDADKAISKYIENGGSTNEDNRKLAANKMAMFFGDKGSGVASAYLTKLVRTGVETGVNFPPPPTGNTGFSIKEVSLANSGLSISAQLTILLMLNMVADNIMHDGLIYVFAALHDALDEEDKKAVAAYMEVIDGFAGSNAKWTGGSSSEQILKFLIDGNKSTFGSNVEASAPKIYLVVEKSRNGKYDRSIYIGESNAKEKYILRDWVGLKQESSFAIANLANATFKKLGSNVEQEKYSAKMPVLMPEKYEEIKNIIVALKLNQAVAVVGEDGIISVAADKNVETYLNHTAKLNTEKALEMMIESFSAETRRASIPANKLEEGDGQESTKEGSAGTELLADAKKKLDDELGKIRALISVDKKDSMEAINNILKMIEIESAKKSIVQGRNK